MSRTSIIRDSIRQMLRDRPGITHGEIVAETGLSATTVTKYLRMIRDEWALEKPFASEHMTPEIESAVGQAMLAEAHGIEAKSHQTQTQTQTQAREACQAKVSAGIERRRATIAKLHAAGLDDRQIADALGMSTYTIRADMRAIGVL